MKKCAKLCTLMNRKCEQSECRQWIDYEEDLNCTLIAVNKNGEMTLREVAERMNLSLVRVRNIERQALRNLS